MEPKETKTGRTGQGNASGRSSPGSKLKTEVSAKKASGAKLKNEKTAQASAGEKLRHDKAVFTDEATKGVKDGMSHGRKTPKGSHASTLISDSVHAKIDRESDDNAGTDAMNRSSQLAEHTAQDGSNAFSAGVRNRRSKRNTQLRKPDRQQAVLPLQEERHLRKARVKPQRKQRKPLKRLRNSFPSTGMVC